MLQELHVTSAPSSRRVSMRTAVCTVMWRHPAILAPASGFLGPQVALRCIRPGISFSARFSSLRPQSAREISAKIKTFQTQMIKPKVHVVDYGFPPREKVSMLLEQNCHLTKYNLDYLPTLQGALDMMIVVYNWHKTGYKTVEISRCHKLWSILY